MSAAGSRLPTTTARAVVVAAVVGTVALAAHEPVVVAAVLGGTALAATTVGFDGSLRRVALASALLPTVVLGTLAVVAQSAGPTAVVLVFVGVTLGLGIGGVVVGSPSSAALRRAGIAAGAAAAVVVAGGLFALGLETSAQSQSPVDAAIWLTRDGLSGLFVGIVVAALAVAGGLLAVPPAAFATPASHDARVAARDALVRSVVLGGVVLAVGLLLVAAVGWVFPLVVAVADSAIVRGLLALVTASGLGLAALGIVVRRSWPRSSRENAIIPIVVGGVCGIVLLLGLAVGVLGWSVVTPLSTGTVVALGVGGALAWYVGILGKDGLPGPVGVIAGALAAGAVVLGALADGGATGLEAVRTGTTPFVALAASLLVYDLGRYGRGLAYEIGPEGATPRPQLVRFAWSATVAAVGVVVAAVGLWSATLLEPTLSVPATAGVLAGVVAVVIGVRFLLR
ncbi:hypothetical protein CV102_00215 [Natronococcus pandeyae]|uniref:Uncharacterized protein n=1 Tax=Natronococcus pandeyae TaxID=2055836 RepID=A0A8J8TTS9_9EURY|nr:hypothetical protein [Natronococcus pandeyae]TYL40042.1 hypothetical protein CV102_00215 [Natronococcus pandeyae]